MAGNIYYTNKHDGSQQKHHGESHTGMLRRMPPVGIKTRRNHKRNKFSSTAGRSKVESCQATPFDRIHARRNRSHKWPTYQAWRRRMDKKAKRSSGGGY